MGSDFLAQYALNKMQQWKDDEERQKIMDAIARFQSPQTAAATEPPREDTGEPVNPELISALSALGGTSFPKTEEATPEFSMQRAAQNPDFAGLWSNPTFQDYIKAQQLGKEEKDKAGRLETLQTTGIPIINMMQDEIDKTTGQPKQNLRRERAMLALSTGNEKELYDALREGGGSDTEKMSVFTQKYKMHATPENQAKNEESIAELERAGAIKPWYANILRNSNTGAGVFETMMELKDISGRVTSAVQSAEEKVPAMAKTAAATSAARENTMREIQKENPILSDAQSQALTDNYMAVNYLNRMKRELSSGNVDYFDIDRKTGQFKNPKVADAYSQLVEIVGRKRSGAAISESEWSNFGKEILNKNFLLSKNGKQQAMQQIEDYLDRYFQAGVNVAGDEDWYNRVKKRGQSAREKADGSKSTSKRDYGAEYGF